MEVKGQTLLMSALIVVITLVIIEIDYFNFSLDKNIFENSKYELDYVKKILEELFLTIAISKNNSVENFGDFIHFVKNDLLSKDYNFSAFVVIVKPQTPNELNVTLFNFKGKNLTVYVYLNSTPPQTSNFLLLDNQNYSLSFIHTQEDYYFEIIYDDKFNMTLDFREKYSVFAYIDIFISNKNMAYKDKSQKSYYFS
ncbi:MAG: hypothetical protein N3E38_00660 [Candidatus Aenigmarchaeota archaeon]|nr:hypothetical protein [Candidatus Aenigmarchaeota archaeon]